MKHRWLLILLLAVALASSACAPTENGEGSVPPIPGQADSYDDY